MDGNNTSDSAISINGQSHIIIDGVKGNAMAGDYNYGLIMQNYRLNCIYTTSGGDNISVYHMDCRNLSLPRQHGTHTGSNGAASLVDSNQSWAVNEWSSPYAWNVINVTEKADARITGNTSNTITHGTLYDYWDNVHLWNYGDEYLINFGDDTGGIRTTLNAGGAEYAYNWIHGSPEGATDDSLKWPVSCIVLWGAESGASYDLHKIHHNKCEYLGMDAIKSGSNTSIYDNIVQNVHLPKTHPDGLLIQGEAHHSAIYNNFVSGSTQCIYLDAGGSGTMSDIWVFNNVVDCRTGSFAVTIQYDGSTISDVKVFNNTFVASNYIVAVASKDDVSNIDFRNNYLGSTGSGGSQIAFTQSSLTYLDYNVYKTGEGHSFGFQFIMTGQWKI
jgi:hypothetical protein